MEKSSYNSMLNHNSHRPTPTKLLENYQQIQQQQQPQMLDQQQQQFNGIFFRSVSNSRVLIEASPQINAFGSYTGLIDEAATNSDYSNLRSFILNSSSSSQIQQNGEDLNSDYNSSGLNCQQQDSDLLFLKDKNIDSNGVCFNDSESRPTIDSNSNSNTTTKKFDAAATKKKRTTTTTTKKTIKSLEKTSKSIMEKCEDVILGGAVLSSNEQQQGTNGTIMRAQSVNNSSSTKTKTKKTKGRVKIKMEFIENKIRRYTTFSKRKTGIMKKAYELSTLTGTQVMLLVASETGHVYTFATEKLQPMITSEAGKSLIQSCLSGTLPGTQDPAEVESGQTADLEQQQHDQFASNKVGSSTANGGISIEEFKYYDDDDDDEDDEEEDEDEEYEEEDENEENDDHSTATAAAAHSNGFDIDSNGFQFQNPYNPHSSLKKSANTNNNKRRQQQTQQQKSSNKSTANGTKRQKKQPQQQQQQQIQHQTQLVTTLPPTIVGGQNVASNFNTLSSSKVIFTIDETDLNTNKIVQQQQQQIWHQQ